MTGSNGRRTWPAELSAAASALLEAGNSAQATGRLNWDFATQITTLCQQDLTSACLRFLIRAGFVDHADEVADHTGATRIYKLTSKFKFSSRTCVILTPLGRAAAEALLQRTAEGIPTRSVSEGLQPAQLDTSQPALVPSASFSLPGPPLVTSDPETPASRPRHTPLWDPVMRGSPDHCF